MALLHTEASYPDDLAEDGMLYHYPITERAAARDLAEVNSTKAAGKLGLPLFVITPGSHSSERRIRFGWVEDWDDRARLSLISFGNIRPVAIQSDSDGEDLPFDLKSHSPRRRAEVDVRQGQHQFKFDVIKRYGPSCAVCGMDVMAVLDAAHLCSKEKQGCDDPRNGLVLCAIHHRALDAGLFAIDPNTTEFQFRPGGPSQTALRIQFPSLSHLPRRPHRAALEWLWNQWRSHGTDSCNSAARRRPGRSGTELPIELSTSIEL
jgi:hypothetical protein